MAVSRKMLYLCGITINNLLDMMKNMKSWMIAAILFCGAGCLVSCNGNADAGDKAASDTVAVDSAANSGNDMLAAVDRYLVDSIGSQYSQGEMCIPCATIVATNQENPDSVLVWGDFWVYNFQTAGDTLKTVSGGDHPGMMCVQKMEDGTYKVTSFDQVEDGSGNLASAKRIFGDMYEAFHGINSDQENREQARGMCIAKYVKANNLPVKYYQDYGWPAVEIKFDDKVE